MSSITDKAKNTAEKLAGQAEEAVGKASGNEDLEARGRQERTAASVKEAAGDVLKG